MWARFVQVIVTPREDPKNKKVFKAHKIDFEVRSTIGWAADTATITITNLSVDEMKFLQSKNFGDMDIELRAGYYDQNDLGGIDKSGGDPGISVIPDTDGTQKGSTTIGTANTIFSGVITNAVGYKRLPEQIFSMFCISKAAFSGTSFKQMRAIPKGATLRDAITSMCEDYGYGTVSQYGLASEDLQTVLPMGRTFHDTFVKEFTDLLGEHNLSFRITTSEIQIFPDTYADKDAVSRMAKDRAPLKIDVNQVIGTPTAGITTFRLDVVLNSAIQPGMVIDVSPYMGTELLVNGIVNVQNNAQSTLNYSRSVFKYAMSDFYLIQEVVHHGSAFGQDFMTSVSAIRGGATAMGSNELSWQTAYANSGMAMEG